MDPAPVRSSDARDERLRLLVETIQDFGMGVVDVDGRIDSWNDGAEKITGHARADVIGRHCSCLYDPEEVARGAPERDLALAARAGRIEIEGWRVRKDGSRYWAHVVTSALRDEKGTLKGFAKVTRDVTEQRLASIALRDREIQLRALFDHTVALMGLVSPEGVLLDANRSALDLVGVDREQVVGRPFWETPWWTHSTTAQAQLRDAVARAGSGVLVRFEVTHVDAAGRTHTIDFSLSPVRDCTGRVAYLVPEGRDVTDRKTLERLREEWIAIVTHDIRHPLNDIVIQAALLARGTPDARAAVDSVQRSARRLDRMVRDLVDLSRLEAQRLDLRRKTTDVVALVRRVIDRVALQFPDRPLRSAIGPDVPSYHLDADRIEQVLENLLTNAVKYGEPGSPIEVKVAADREHVSIAVTNRGRGIPPAEIPEIFQRFHRGSSTRGDETRGLGVGLYVARGLVEAHGGKIEVESRVGETTTFRVLLPCAEDLEVTVA